MEIELAFYYAAVQHVSHNAEGIPFLFELREKQKMYIKEMSEKKDEKNERERERERERVEKEKG